MSVFITILLIVFAISASFSYRNQRRGWTERLRGIGEDAASGAIQNGSSSLKTRLFKFLGTLGEATKSTNVEELTHLRRTLLKAGYRRSDAMIIFYGAKLCLAICLPVAFALLRTSALSTLPYMQTMVLFVFTAVIGLYIPNLWVRMKVRHRQNQILLGFPDALDLMVVCVEAGLGLDAAMQQATEEIRLSNEVLSEELRLVNLELRAGQSRQNALKNLSLRTDLEDINNFATLLIQTDSFGTSIAQALRVQSDAMRTKRYHRAEEMAAKIAVKLMFPLIFFIFPSLFIVILGPAVIQVIRILLPVMAAK